MQHYRSQVGSELAGDAAAGCYGPGSDVKGINLKDVAWGATILPGNLKSVRIAALARLSRPALLLIPFIILLLLSIYLIVKKIN